jgi:preprotein translocase subunit SecD
VRLQTINGQPGIIAELPHFDGNERQIVGILVQTGVLAFWNTGLYGVLVAGTSFNPDLYTQYNPDSKPRFTNQDLDATAFAVIHDPSTPTNVASTSCMMKGNALNRFRLFTAHNIGNALTLTLDGKVLASEVIANSVSGPFDFIVADFTQQQADAIVSVLAHSPLPVSLKAVS